MTWTTSARLRARPFIQQLAGTGLKRAQACLAAVRRTPARTRNAFALALPLAGLGFLSPALPPSLTCVLLLAAGAAIMVFGSEPPQLVRKVRATTRRARRSTAPAHFKISEISLEQIEPRRLPPHGASMLVGRPNPAYRRPTGDFAGLMARVNHELRTPLNAVIGFSEVMALQLFGPLANERYQEYVGYIRDSASEVLKSAEDTLALTALMSGAHAPEAGACTLQHVAADAWSLIARKAAGRGIELDICFGPELEVLSEPRTLRQVMVNVLSEAITRAAHGERILLMAAADGELVEIRISVSVERPRASIGDTSLSMSLARTLLEMQGTSLLEIDSPVEGWKAVTVLDRAVQTDFFTQALHALEEHPLPALTM